MAYPPATIMDKPFNDKLSIPELEEKVSEFWDKDGTFKRSLEKTKAGEPYTFYDGPPFATGLPHYGHILASTIKDLIPRYQTMRGHFVRRRWGWDCHGLPIEEIVEKKLGISGKKQIEEIGIKKFNETCRSMVLTFADEWGKMVRRMGRWIEFENSYKTMDRTFMESVWWAFKNIHDKGLVYEGRKVLLYCPRCETPISNFEVAMDNSYKDISEESIFVKFRVKGESGVYVLAWTTTPWTLPGNVALAVGKDIIYVRAEKDGEVLILAKELADPVLGEGYKIQGEMTGAELAGTEYEPLFDVPGLTGAPGAEKAYRVYTADFVTTTDGTGVVHTAVVYGEDDYRLGQEIGLPVVPLLDEKGHFNDKAPELIRGQYLKKAEKAIKDDLQGRGLVFRLMQNVHSYPHCWRCGTALYYNAIPAWFINIQSIKSDLLHTNEEQINWFPAHLKSGRYHKSVEAAPDWNISRNRYWGNPIPVWKCAYCDKLKVAGSVADLGLAPTTIYFLRHGEAEQNVAGTISCYPEIKSYHLTETGRAQAEAAAQLLKEKGVDMIFASDLQRTTDTAEIISKATGAEVVFDERLREFNTGVWNGKPVADYWKSRPPEGWWKSAPEGGESWTDLQARMQEFTHELTAKYPGKKIAVVSHGDPLWLVLRQFGIDNGEPTFADVKEITTGPTDLHRPYIDEVVLACECGGEMRRTPEIFDSWVEAGSMPFSEYHYPFENKELFESRFPAQFVAEYIAQTRAWFYVMHVISQILFGRAPFENVVTTGTILAEDGSKMSKSKNNYPDPWLVINKYGVDTLRFYLMNSVVMQADNLNFSMKDLETAHRKVTMLLWNVYQYYATYAPENVNASAGSANVLDRWITARLKELVAEVTKSFDEYNTVSATRAMEKFVDDLSTWYLRRSRGREDAGFFPTFLNVLITLARVLAPVMPHMAEAVYMNLGNTESVHLSGWPAAEEISAEEKELIAQVEVVREAASVGLAIRKQSNLPVRQPLPKLSLDAELSAELAEVLKAEMNVKEISSGELKGEGILSAPETESRKVWLDTNITEELKLEGLVRNLERFVQEMRKAQGLKVGEQAVLRYDPSDEEIDKAFAAFDSKKTYIARIEKAPVPDGGDFEGKAKVAIERV